MLRVWNLCLLLATFALTIFGTFLTRSGVLDSVHSFTQSPIGPWLLTAFGVVVVVSLGLIAWRGDRLRSPGSIDSPLSREGAFLTNNLLFSAFAFVVVLEATGRGTFTDGGVDHALLLMGGGVVTAIPLLLFGAAAVRISLTTIGLLQYIAPSMHFAIGVTIRGEEMPASRWIGFALVWLAVSVFTWDSLRSRRPVAVRRDAGASRVRAWRRG